MEYGENTSIYLEVIFQTFQKILLPLLQEEREKNDHESPMMNMILGLDGPRSVPHNSSPTEYFIANKIFRPISEIFNTVESIENIAIYIRTFPYKRQGISKVSYLKYHVENYLNELYLLKNRLIAHLNLIEKSYKKSATSLHVSQKIKPLYDVISKVLEGYVELRGIHVHQYRYSDYDFDRLSFLELLSRGKTEDNFKQIIKNLLNDAYSETRKKWIAKINSDVDGIHGLLEFYFEQLISALIADGKLIFPDNLKTNNPLEEDSS